MPGFASCQVGVLPVWGWCQARPLVRCPNPWGCAGARNFPVPTSTTSLATAEHRPPRHRLSPPPGVSMDELAKRGMQTGKGVVFGGDGCAVVWGGVRVCVHVRVSERAAGWWSGVPASGVLLNVLTLSILSCGCRSFVLFFCCLGVVVRCRVVLRFDGTGFVHRFF